MLLLLPCALGAQSVNYLYDATLLDPNPIEQGWGSSEVTAPGADAAPVDGLIDAPANVGPINDAQGASWQIVDQLSATSLDSPAYPITFEPGQFEALYDHGWEYEFTVKAVQETDFSGFTGWGLTAANDPGWGFSGSSARVGFFFGVNDNNSFWVSINSGTKHYVLESGDDFHTVRAIGAPESTEFEWFIDGVSQGIGNLESIGAHEGLIFQAGSSPRIGGAANWKKVSLQSLDAETVYPTTPITGTVLFGGDEDYFNENGVEGLLTLSPATSEGVVIEEAYSDSGYYRLNILGVNDVSSGALLTSVAQNGRFQTVPSGSDFATNSILPLASLERYAIVTSRTSDFEEYNIDAAFGWFPYSAYLAGVASGVGANPPLTQLTASAGIELGEEVTATGTGVAVVDLTSLGASSADGILLASAAESDDNIALVTAEANGTFTVHVRQNNSSALEQGAFSFVYLPFADAGAPDQTLTALGRVRSDGAAPESGGNFVITKHSVGRWLLAIPGQTNDTGALLVTPAGSGPDNADNIVTYEWDDSQGGWFIECRDGDFANFGLDDGATDDEVMFNFAFFALEPPTPVELPPMLDHQAARELRANSDSLIGNGIDTASGALVRGVELLRIEGVRPITFEIEYNSLLTSFDGPVGPSWSHNYQARLYGTNGGEITVFWNQHRYSRFEYLDEPEHGLTYRGLDEDVRYASLVARTPDSEYPDSFWILATPEGEAYHFGVDGRLVLMENVIGQPIELTYNDADQLTQLTDPFTEAYISIGYNEDGRISMVSDELGRQVLLTYNAAGNLITLPAAVMREAISWGEPFVAMPIPDNNPAGISVPIDVTEGGYVSGLTFDALEIQHSDPEQLEAYLTTPSGREISLPLTVMPPDTINLAGLSFTQMPEEDRMGEWTLHIVDNEPTLTGTLHAYELSFYSSRRAVTYIYDSENRITQAIDTVGDQLFAADYDAQGRIVRQADGRPETPDATVAYNAISDSIETVYTDPLGNNWRFVHDAEHHILSVENPLGGTGSFTYDENGNRLTLTDALDRTTTFTYTERGDIATMEDPLGNTTTFTYGDAHDLLSITDALERTTTFTREQGRLRTVTDALDYSQSRDYYANGQVSSYTSPDGATVHYGLDSKERVNTATNPRNGEVGLPDSEQEASYDLAGRTISQIDYGGNVTTTVYTPTDEVRSQTDPDLNTSRNDYDYRGHLMRSIDKLNATTTYTYDGNGNILTATNAIGEVTTFDYDHDDRLTSITNARGSTVSYEYDALGRLTNTTDPLGRTDEVVYDAVDNIIARYDPSGTRMLLIEYDARDLPVRMEDALGHVITAEYDAVMRKVSSTDELGRTTTFEYDALDRLISVTDPEGRTSANTYARDDMLDTFTQPGASTHYTIVYDNGNNPIFIVDPLNGTEDFAFNTRNLLTQDNKDSGREVVFDYDDVGRLLTSTPDSPTANDYPRSYTYDADNKLLEVSAEIDGVDTLRTKRTYDAIGRIATYTSYRIEGGATIGETLIYGYDEAGNLSRLIYPDGADVRYEYDAADRLVKVIDWVDRETLITWDNQDRIARIDFPNGAQRNIRYDAAGNVIYREDLASDSSIIIAYAYSYDAAGRLQSEHATPEVSTLAPTEATYSYDERNWMTQFNGNSVSSDPYGYLQNASTPTLNNVQFNNRGRLIRTQGYAFINDEEDRLNGWQPFGSAESQRTNFFINPEAGMSQVLLQTGPSQSKRYVYGVGLFYEEDATTGEIKVLHYDNRGSTVAISNDSGELVGQIAYSPYGEITERMGDTDTLFLYNGMFGVMTSPDGLNYMRFRWYSPKLRRFISQDAHYGSIRDLNTLNRYAYAGGNPVMMVDPEGEFWWIAGGAAAGAAVGLTVTFVVDLVDDGQINTPGEQYAAAAIGGAVTGAILSTGVGLTGGAGFAVAALAGGAGAAAENLSHAGLTGTKVDGKQLAIETITGAVLGAASHGAGKVVSKAGSKFYAKSFGSTNRFIKFASSLARPDKVSRRLAVSSYSNLVKRSAKKEVIQGALSVFKKLPGGLYQGFQSANSISGEPTSITQDGGQRGAGVFNIRSEALGEVSMNQSRQYGEYIHYNFFLEAVQLTSQPVPNHPTHTLSGF